MKPTNTRAPGDLNRLASRRYVLCMALAAGLAGPVWAAEPLAGPELLEAEKAFSVTARLVDDKTLELRYAIADGYYMYRDRFLFSINGQPVSVSRQAWPIGKWKQDASFGKVVIYRNSVRLLLPASSTKLDGTQAAGNLLTLTASSQGCADAGICYPPLRQTVVLAAGSSAWVGPRDEFSSGFSHGRPPGGGLADRLTTGR